jgi:hypothetical protein
MTTMQDGPSHELNVANEIEGASERPSGSKVIIATDKESGETEITIPPKLPGSVIGTVLGIVLLVMIAGLVAGIKEFAGHISEFPPILRLFVITGLATAPILVIALISVGLKSTARQEVLHFDTEDFSIVRKGLIGASTNTYPMASISGVQCRRDFQGLRESQLVLTLTSREPEIELAGSAAESEKQWLASVLSVLIAHAQNRQHM